MTGYSAAFSRFAHAKDHLETLVQNLTRESLDGFRDTYDERYHHNWLFALTHYAPDPEKIAAAAVAAAEHEVEEARLALIAALNAEGTPPAEAQGSENVVPIKSAKGKRRTSAP